MKIQVNSDKNILMDAQAHRFVRGEANRALGRFKSKLTRVEFHLSDVNSHKFGKHDKRCLIEVRPAGHRPLAVRVASPNVRTAVLAALVKLRSALETFFGRMEKRRTIARGPKLRLAIAHANGARPIAKKAVARRVKRAATARNKAVHAKRAKRAVARKIVAKKIVAKKAAARKVAARRTIAKKAVARKVARKRIAAAARAPKKKAIYQARRKSWPARRAALSLRVSG